MEATKEQLKEQLRLLEEEELNSLIEINYPKFKALEGKCFKVQNCYSCPQSEDDYWFMYIKITKIEKFDLYKSIDDILAHFQGISFQTDKYGKISIDFEYTNYVHSMSQDNEITDDEFIDAWLHMQGKITLAYNNVINP